MKTKIFTLNFILFFTNYLISQNVSYIHEFASAGVFTYNDGPSNEEITDVKILDDNTVIALGNTDFDPDEGGKYRIVLIKLLANGQYDNSFGTNGKVYVDTPNSTDYGYKLGIQSTGKILVAGYTGINGAIYRFNANGTIDSSFGVQGKASNTDIGESYFRNIIVTGDDKIIVSGSSKVANRYGCLVAKFNANGSVDSSFGGGKGFNIVRSSTSSSREDDGAGRGLDVQPDGKILTSGVDEAYYGVICRFNPNGTIDTGFGDLGNGFIVFERRNSNWEYELPVIKYHNDRIYVFGEHSLVTSSNYEPYIFITKLQVNGNKDGSFGISGRVETEGTAIKDILFLDDGHILAATTDGVTKINSTTGKFMWTPEIISFRNKFSNDEYPTSYRLNFKNNRLYVCGTYFNLSTFIYDGFIIGFNYTNTTSTEDGNSFTDLISIFPNPASHFIIIEGNVEKIEIFNSSGYKMNTTDGINNDNHTTIDVSNLPNGMYMVHMQITGQVRSTKFIKI